MKKRAGAGGDVLTAIGRVSQPKTIHLSQLCLMLVRQQLLAMDHHPLADHHRLFCGPACF